ncbi:hypothetical protein CKM354_001018700 [Cercospora kikuchii]|uniref:Uncharacterized protein n=1 Tax=Cercospora kikuchii TaxID=84275 RepID=A0A9P3FH19_9PEZI|nr:uncharacterized protein CKM354_001018700 [Cercospora kikuchii]GIZ47086.1 hypothetical protein CKM354_001018700 [Cercospora kikuchii]
MENSPFNNLSAELRNEIWQLALKSDTPLAIGGTSAHGPTAAQPPLTRAYDLKNWLRFISTNKYHEAISKMGLVVWVPAMGNCGWIGDWKMSLLNGLQTYGFGGAHENRRLKVTVRMACWLSEKDQSMRFLPDVGTERLQRKETARKFFERLGMEVDEVTWETMYDERDRRVDL